MGADTHALWPRSERARTWAAAGAYLAIAVFATWPLARGLAKDVPSDLGDPLLNMWILSWDCEQLRALFGGDLARLRHLFDGNIFYPAPLTLTYSEHLFPQALQIFPVYLATRNPILCYNLLFLSTFVLSGVGAYLLVRELTGDWRAALVGGLLFAFAPYRIPQSSHLQVLSSQWMPLTLYGFTRYLNTRRRRALAGGVIALVLQNLSCGYFLLYFAPFAVAYLAWEVSRRRLWRDRTLLIELTVAGLAAAALTAPFLVPYARAHKMITMTRSIDEVVRYSADVYSYFTAAGTQHVWGTVMSAFPKSEGELFSGAVPLFLGMLAVGGWIIGAWRAGRDTPWRMRGLVAFLAAVAVSCLALAIVALFARRLVFDLGVTRLRIVDIGRAFTLLVAILAALTAISPRARVRLRALVTVEGFFCVAVMATWWLSLGPRPQTLGRPLDLPAPYAILYDFVPGFDGLRAPARYGMIMALMLAVAGALAAATLLRRRWGPGVVAALAVAFVVEAHASPFDLNGHGASQGYEMPDARVYRPDRAPSLYHRVAALPSSTVLLELPVGNPTWDLRAVYYSTVHWHPIVNGYSGFFPPDYALVVASLTDPDRTGEAAWAVLRAVGATHILVHEVAFRPPKGDQIARWLRGAGATELARDGKDVLYALPR